MKNNTKNEHVYINTKALNTEEAKQLEKEGFILKFVRITETKAIYNIYANKEA